ncbi:Helix-turn-helix domain-containing protein, partial [Thiohalomonas denitrificans]
MGHQYRQLTHEERYQIGALMELGFSQAEVARKLGRNRSTISREVRRNRQGTRYQATKAQRMSDKRRREA